MILIHGAPKSRAFRVIWTLEELRLPYEWVPTTAAEARKPELLQLNPNGSIPILVDGRDVFWESLAINLYLCEKYGGGALWPSSVEGRGHATKWSFWALAHIEARVDLAAQAQLPLPEGHLDPPLWVLEAQLQSSPHLLGADFSVADLNVCTPFFLPAVARVDLQAYPAVQDWLTRCTARDAFQRMEQRVQLFGAPAP